MHGGVHRSLFVLVAAVLLSLGFAVKDIRAVDMDINVTATSIMKPIAYACTACGGNKGIAAQDDCHALCNSPAAVLPRDVPGDMIGRSWWAQGILRR